MNDNRVTPDGHRVRLGRCLSDDSRGPAAAERDGDDEQRKREYQQKHDAAKKVVPGIVVHCCGL